MRKPRLEFPGALYHVISRGNQRQSVFWDDGDRVRYLKLLGEHLEGRSFVLYAYCLMSNHVHIIIEQCAVFPLSRYMQRLQSAYTNFFNRKHNKTGHLFQGRYKSILVDRVDYLLELVRYIHLNPHRAEIKNPDKYLWSSHRQYIGKDRYPLAPVKTDAVLSTFSGLKPLARARYSDYLKEKRPELLNEKLYDLRDGRILGDEKFEKEVYVNAGVPKNPSLKLKMDVNQIWTAILLRENLKIEPVGHKKSKLMCEAAYLAIEGTGLRQKDVANYFSVDPTTIAKGLKKLENNWSKGVGSRDQLLRWASRL